MPDEPQNLPSEDIVIYEDKPLDPQHLKPKDKGLEFRFDNALQFLLYLMPDFIPHPKQAAALMLMSGYTVPGKYTPETRVKFDEENPLMFACPAANGSGKDMVLLAAFAVYHAVTGQRNRAIVTSASYEQLRYQTEPHIKVLVDLCNLKFGKIFNSVLFHHVCTRTAAEIKLFVTDEPGRAEGYHPWPGGKMALCLNEVKSIKDELCNAFRRCSGFSYWIEVSSPGLMAGQFFRSCQSGIPYPNQLIPGQYYTLKIAASDCPHIPRSHIEWCRANMEPAWVASSIDAEFMNTEVDVVIPRELIEACGDGNEQVGTDVAISLDSAAGRDETAAYVRRGNTVEYFKSFVERNTVHASLQMNACLQRFKHEYDYFWADDGGISRSFCDNFTAMDWTITRVRNDATARRKQEFMNRGAELYFHMKRLLAQKLINVPPDPILRAQLSSRRYDNLAQGKFRLEPKDEHKKRERSSPDRADAFVLCFGSYAFQEARDAVNNFTAAKPTGFTYAQIRDNPKLIEAKLWTHNQQQSSNRRRLYSIPSSRN